jgi:hypothetical protein
MSTEARSPIQILRDLFHAVARKLLGDFCIKRLGRCNIGLGTGVVAFLLFGNAAAVK